MASSKALDLLHQAMRVVLYRCTAAAINMATFLGVFVDCCLFACCPGDRWGNTEQVVTRWRLPGASSVALDFAAWWDATFIASTHPHGHQNGLQRRQICSSLSILSSTITVAKQHSNT